MPSTPPMSARLNSVAEAIRHRRVMPHTSPKEANITHAFFREYADLPLAERQARSVVYALEREPIHYLEDEAIAGQVFQGCPGSGDPLLNGTADPALLEASGGQWPEFCVAGAGARWVAERLPEHALYGRWFSDGAAPGHIGWDWRLVLELGFEGLLERYRAAMASPADDRAAEFYRCACIALEGAIAFADRLASGASPALRSVCQRVPRRPSTTFAEAVQAFWTQYLAVMFENPYGGNGPGLVDRFLWPYLERDLAVGTVTIDRARDLVRELFLKLDERIHPHDGWVEAICVGGHTADGRGAECLLSHMMVETIMELNQTHPSVYIRLR
ncbi:MAG TPA: pyruvate formate lyase family protein, partial [Armatimonadota bacterium]|nr:pyruvate formate lyase family protein [Armatimonadota bacterium]